MRVHPRSRIWRYLTYLENGGETPYRENRGIPSTGKWGGVHPLPVKMGYIIYRENGGAPPPVKLGYTPYRESGGTQPYRNVGCFHASRPRSPPQKIISLRPTQTINHRAPHLPAYHDHPQVSLPSTISALAGRHHGGPAGLSARPQISRLFASIALDTGRPSIVQSVLGLPHNSSWVVPREVSFRRNYHF